jgi:lysophospholipase L1-like esterase
MRYPIKVRFALLALFASVCSPGLLAQGAATAPLPAAPSVERDPRFELPETDDGLPGTGPLRRYEWFRSLWRERRSGWAKREQQDQGALVFLGDSITQGWGGTLSALFPGSPIANRGISGDTTRGVLLRLQDDVLRLNPRGIVLLIGTNDLEEQAEPETIAANLRLILGAIQQHRADLPVVLCHVFPSSASKKRPADKIRKTNALIAEVVKSFPSVTLLDTWALFADPRGDARPEEFPDLLHLNATAYAKWAAALRPILENLGLLPAWPDDFKPEPGFESLFDGRSLRGWTEPGGRPLGAETITADGRFRAVNGRLITTVSRAGQPHVRLATARAFPGDFVLKLEFRASPNADSGIFVRGPQLQCRDYAIAGPFHGLKHYRPLDWNEVTIEVRGGVAHATCNGEVLVDAFAVPATGPIALESDRGQMEYRRIRIKETAAP